MTTSFWHSLPAQQVWENPRYPNIDYVDVHAYVSTGWIRDAALESDAAGYDLAYSSASRILLIRPSHLPTSRANRLSVVKQDSISSLEQKENPALSQDRQGIWLHNFLWSSLDPGALYELYWWSENRENQPGPDGVKGLHEIYRGVAAFLSGLHLNNGRYQDLSATTNNPGFRVVGQKAPGDGLAHLWVQNRSHTWKNVVSGAPIPAASGTVSIGGFAAGSSFKLERWDPYSIANPAVPISETVVTSDGEGRLSI